MSNTVHMEGSDVLYTREFQHMEMLIEEMARRNDQSMQDLARRIDYLSNEVGDLKEAVGFE